VRKQLDALGVAFALHDLYKDEADAGRRREIICIAPHGGGIEPWTRFMAMQVRDRVECDYWSAWADFRSLLELGIDMETVDKLCKKLHITSHRIWERPVLYPALSELLAGRERPYALSLAIHGKADDSDDGFHIEVGGTSEHRHAVTERLHDLRMRVREPRGTHAGRNPRNIVNLLGRESIQVEIPRSYRRHPVFGRALVGALVETLNAF